MITEIRLKKGSGVPSSLKCAEPAVDMLNRILYIGMTQGENGGSDFLKIIDETKIIDMIAQSINNNDLIIKSLGSSSIITNDIDSNMAYGDYSFSSGHQTISGAMGYYWSNIIFGEEIFNEDETSTGKYGPCVITLCKEQPVDITDVSQVESFNVGYEIGDVISIINNSKYYNCATITNINQNIIEVDSLPFNNMENMVDELGVDDYMFFCIEKYMIGTVNVGRGSHAEGDGSHAYDRASHAEGILSQAIGQYSHAEGRETIAYYAAHAEGQQTQAIGEYSHSEGIRTISSGLNSHAEGYTTEAKGRGAHAEGFNTHANGEYSHTEGYATTAGGTYAHSEGQSNNASGNASHAEGRNGMATHDSAHSEGVGCRAIKDAAHAEGKSTIAEGYRSHAEGEGTHAKGNNQHVQGKYNIPNASYAHIVGNGTKTVPSDAHTLDWNGNACFAGNVYANGASQSSGKKLATEEYVASAISNIPVESGGVGVAGTGNNSEVFNNGEPEQASGMYSHAEGMECIASGNESHAEGCYTGSIGHYSHSEGYDTNARGEASHSEGWGSIAEANKTHAEGGSVAGIEYIGNDGNTVIKGDYSHAEGASQSWGDYSHAEGTSNTGRKITEKDATTGENIETYYFGDYAHAEGNGTIACGSSSHSEGFGAIACGGSAHAEGQATEAKGSSSHAQNYKTKAYGLYSHAEGKQSETLDGARSAHAEGEWTIATVVGQHTQGKFNDTADPNFSNYAHVVGNGTSNTSRSNTHTLTWSGIGWYRNSVFVGGNNYTEGKKLATEEYVLNSIKDIEISSGGIGISGEGENSAIFNDYVDNIASGKYSHAEGLCCQAIGDYSHAEGNNTYAVGDCSHAEGMWSCASADYSHVEGRSTIAGESAHAEGMNTQANGLYSHAEGNGTIAGSIAQHVQGKFNVEDTEEKYLHISGNGESDTKRSNAYTLDWHGNAWYKSNIYIGGNNQNEGKKIATEEYVNNKIDEISITGGDVDLTAIYNMINNLHYYCNKDITYNAELFTIQKDIEDSGDTILHIDCTEVNNGLLVIPYNLGYQDVLTVTSEENVIKIIIPRGLGLYHHGEFVTDEKLVEIFPNLQTIVRIHEDGAVLSYNIAEQSMN